jgi:hypothetical protein
MKALCVVCATCLAAGALVGCVRTRDGIAVPATVATEAPITAPSALPTDAAESTIPGVIETTREAIPPNALPCFQDTNFPMTTTARVSDPAAPTIAIGVPDGWTPSPGSGDIGARLDGPDGMWATVTIAATPLDPAAAFTRYADDVMAKSPVTSVSLLPAEFCGYSGQKLTGMWSDAPGQSVEFADRITHIWTNAKNYLAVIHVEAPSGAPGFDAATSVLMDDFSIGIP